MLLLLYCSSTKIKLRRGYCSLVLSSPLLLRIDYVEAAGITFIEDGKTIMCTSLCDSSTWLPPWSSVNCAKVLWFCVMRKAISDFKKCKAQLILDQLSSSPLIKFEFKILTSNFFPCLIRNSLIVRAFSKKLHQQTNFLIVFQKKLHTWPVRVHFKVVPLSNKTFEFVSRNLAKRLDQNSESTNYLNS